MRLEVFCEAYGAVGIWPGAQFIWNDRHARALRVFEDQPTHDTDDWGWVVENDRWLNSKLPMSSCCIDLEDPDTLAAFDRRLALRLGAPEEAVREGVCVVRVFGDLHKITAGLENHEHDRDSDGGFGGEYDSPRWEKDLPRADDPLLARVRAWKSVPG